MVGQVSKGKGKVDDEKDKIPIDDEPNGEKLIDLGSKKDGKKKRIKKIIYYESDTSSTTSHRDDSSPSKQKTNKSTFNRTPFNYSCISRNSNAQLLSIPLGKAPHFDGEDYSWWSQKMRSHLFSFHPCIWDIVENGMHIPNVDNENYNEVEVEELIYRNAQATTVLLASPCT
jgi:hypothetical protein